MLNFPFDSALQRNQPLFFLGDDVYVIGRRPEGPATFVTALGVQHPLRRLSATRTLLERTETSNRATVSVWLQEELAKSAILEQDPFSYFVHTLAPAFAQRDWSEAHTGERPHSSQQPSADVYGAIAQAVVALPLPQLPSSAMCLLGRVWMLAGLPARDGAMAVYLGRHSLGLTGEYVLVRTMENDWHTQVKSFVKDAASSILKQHPKGAMLAKVAEGRKQLSQTGCYQMGDLIYLDGKAPLLGHILPSHHNRVLGRQSIRDLAMVAPLTLPPKLALPSVYTLTSQGRWQPFGLPHGLCLGASPPSHRPDSPGLALAAYLRWAACRIASNGIFHSKDDSSYEDNHDYY
jgi:hypothetical protein